MQEMRGSVEHSIHADVCEADQSCVLSCAPRRAAPHRPAFIEIDHVDR